MPPEVSSQSPYPEQTMGGTQYYIEPWLHGNSIPQYYIEPWLHGNSIPLQVTDASSKIKFKKQIQMHLMEQRDCEATQT
jgi:hypothetical protein